VSTSNRIQPRDHGDSVISRRNAKGYPYQVRLTVEVALLRLGAGVVTQHLPIACDSCSQFVV